MLKEIRSMPFALTMNRTMACFLAWKGCKQWLIEVELSIMPIVGHDSRIGNKHMANVKK